MVRRACGCRPTPTLLWKRDLAMVGRSHSLIRAPSQKLSHLHPCPLEISSTDSWATQCGDRGPQPRSRTPGFRFCLLCDPGAAFALSELVAIVLSPRDPSARTHLFPCAPRNVGLSEESALRVHQPRSSGHLLCVGPVQGAGPQFTPFFEVITPLRADLEHRLLRSSMEKSTLVNMDLPDVREESKWDIKAPFM